MLDLLIHVTAANKLSPSSHVLQVTDDQGRFIQYKPSTPIGKCFFIIFFFGVASTTTTRCEFYNCMNFD